MRSIGKNVYIARAVRVAAILALIWIAGLFSAAGVVSAPAAPGNLTAVVSNGGQVGLHWTDNSSDETGFLVERAADNLFINFRVSFRVPANVTSFTDNTVAVLTTYYYRVSAVNAQGNSSPSNTATATTPANLAFPKAPIDFTGKVQSASVVTLNWKDQSNNEDGFRVERADDNLFTQGLKTFPVKAGSIFFTDSGLEPLKTYYYRVIAWNAAGDSPSSDVVSLTTVDAPPQAPSDLNVQFMGNKQVKLRWTDNSNNETGFRIQRATDSNFSRDLTLFTAEANAGSRMPVTVTDRQAPAGTFYYRVQAYNDSGDSFFSSAMQTTVSNQPNLDTPLYVGNTATVSFPGFNSLTGPVTINWLGQLQGSAFTLNTADNKATLSIPGGTQMMNVNGHPLTTFTYNTPDILPQPPGNGTVVEAFDFGPNGATFSNKVTLSLKYDPADFPQLTTYNDLKGFSWNGTDWQSLADFMVIPNQQTITATITHQGLVAIVSPTPDLSAKFTVSNLQIFPQTAHVGDTVTISVTVTNVGYKYGYDNVTLKLNGAQEDTKQVSLEAADHTDVKFTVNKPANDYVVDINGTPGWFTVRANPLASSSPTATPTATLPLTTNYSPVVPSEPTTSFQWPVLVIIVSAAVLFILALIFFLVRR